MAIPASQIVEVTPRLLQPGGSDLEMNGLLLSKNADIPTDTVVLPFATPESVAAYFGAESREYALARIYFLGYDNSFIKPSALFFARYLDEAAAPWIRGGKLDDSLAAFRTTLPQGSLTLTLGLHTDELSGLDFSGVESFSEAALLLQGAIRANIAGGEAWAGATVSYSSFRKGFTISGGVAGADQAVAYATGPLAEALKLTLQQGAVLSQGADALGTEENMARILAVTQNWATFTQLWPADSSGIAGLAAWASARGVQYLYCAWSDDANLLQPYTSGNPASRLAEEGLNSVTLHYGTADYAVFIMGCAASIDFNRKEGVINFAFKSQAGLAPNVTGAQEAANLLAKNVNFYGNYATRNDNFVFLYNASMFGKYRFIDPYINALWFNNALQTALMAGLKAVGRVPYTDSGYTLVRSWLMDPINRALKNGIINPGVTLSEQQRSELAREAGYDIANTLNTDGYYIQVLDPSPVIRAERQSPTVNIWYTYGGSINRIEVASTASL